MPFLQLIGITKKFGDFTANHEIDFNLNKGEVHALLGENGAGKSTLMNIVSGRFQPCAGDMFINGRKTVFKNAKSANLMGIHMVHQHFMLVPVFSVAENILLGVTSARSFHKDLNFVRSQIRTLGTTFGLHLPSDEIVQNLSVGMQQRVEIMKALFRDLSVLILDEPTAVLSSDETDALFRIIHKLKENGTSIIFITHKLKEVMTIADQITVMRKGRVIGTVHKEDTDPNHLAQMMIGEKRNFKLPLGSPPGQTPLFIVNRISVTGENQLKAVKTVSFKVHKGEILGIAGVQGNGQTELVEALTGLRKTCSGTIHLKGLAIQDASVRQRIALKMAHIPEDRRKSGLVLPWSVADNLSLCSYFAPPFAGILWRHFAAIHRHARQLIRRFDLMVRSPDATVDSLSGGNQQKVILARELSRSISFLIANQPTRGLDIGSIDGIHRQFLTMREQGAGILLVSTDLDEILNLSDRVMVMYEGRLSEPMIAEQLTLDKVAPMMAGMGLTTD